MKLKDQELALEAKNRRRRQEFGKKLNYPDTLAEKRFVQFGGDLGSMGGGVAGRGARLARRAPPDDGLTWLGARSSFRLRHVS